MSAYHSSSVIVKPTDETPFWNVRHTDSHGYPEISLSIVSRDGSLHLMLPLDLALTIADAIVATADSRDSWSEEPS